MKPYYVYILRLSGGSFYTGITTDPQRRFRQHRGEIKGGAKATKINAPEKIECVFKASDRSSASKLEYSLKRLSHSQKEKIISGEADVPPEYIRVTATEYRGLHNMLFVCYPKCSTCKKAQAYLDAKGAKYDFRDIKEQNPTEDELRMWHNKSGLPLKRFFNTSGQKYRELELTKKLPGMTEDEIFALLSTDGMLVKRPILVTDSTVLVGFRQDEWESAL